MHALDLFRGERCFSAPRNKFALRLGQYGEEANRKRIGIRRVVAHKIHPRTLGDNVHTRARIRRLVQLCGRTCQPLLAARRSLNLRERLLPVPDLTLLATVSKSLCFPERYLMSFITKQYIAAALGKAQFWFPKRIAGLEYLAGIPELDAIRDPTAVLSAAPLRVGLLPRGLGLRITYRFEEYSFGIAYTDIQEIAAELPQDLVASPSQVSWGRALLGGLVLGPVGALVGGLSGRPERELTEPGDAILLFRLVHAGVEQVVAATVRKRNRARTKRFLLTYYQQAAPDTRLTLAHL